MSNQQFLNEHCLYQDNDLMVINKPAGLLTIPGKGDLTDSLLTRLQQVEKRTLLIHRLDRDTSGLLVFALNKPAQSHISKQFQARTTEKIYHALLVGHLHGQGTVDIPVVYDETRPPLHIVDPNASKPAITEWQAIEQFTLADLPVTRVILRPITGRSHQLRVHMQHLGHAIVGDTLYTAEPYQSLTPILCLQAKQLQLTHPTTGKILNFCCDAIF